MWHAERSFVSNEGAPRADSPRSPGIFRLRLAAALLLGGSLAGLQWAYHENRVGMFFGGLAAWLGLAAVWLRFETPRVAHIGWMVWQRGAASIVMLALIEAGYRSSDLAALPRSGSAARAEVPLKMLTYAEGKHDPQKYAAWWEQYRDEWVRDQDLIVRQTPREAVPYVFKPGTSRQFFGGTVRINELGLVGPEVSFDKGDRYRIVVLGASHTQGTPMEPDDSPWPEKLERLIAERVDSPRKIEVLNAGVAGYTMAYNLHRLKTVVLPLKPDLIITYFGSNDFRGLRGEIPLPKIPPGAHARRASLLISKLDDRYSKWWACFGGDPAPIEDLRTIEPQLARCRMARLYEEYLRLTREVGVPLVACNFGMALDRSSPPEAVAYYSQGFPDVKFLIEANRLNSAMLPLVVRPETGGRVIDIQEGLDGAYGDQFIDLVHLTDAGNERLAENVFRGIVGLLPADSTRPELPPVADRPDPGTTLR